jgi:hypothetical protein
MGPQYMFVICSYVRIHMCILKICIFIPYQVLPIATSCAIAAKAIFSDGVLATAVWARDRFFNVSARSRDPTVLVWKETLNSMSSRQLSWLETLLKQVF